MNNVKLKGILRDIEHSHSIGDIEYDKADLIVQRENGIDDIISLRFKKFSNTYKDGDTVSLVGNVRSYSKQLNDGKNKVDIYVFTYFDSPEEDDITNSVIVDGRICKIEDVRILPNGKKNIHFIVANNLVTSGGKKLNSYLPCIAWGKTAQEISNMRVNDFIQISGKLQSREYKKYISEDDFEIRIAHEVYVDSVLKEKDE
jgi:single-stranded DNA-binding protein